jgi:hypothetical protein
MCLRRAASRPTARLVFAKQPAFKKNKISKTNKERNMAQLNFNASEIETSSHDPIPAGNYEAVVAASEMRPVKSGNGMGINLTFEIISDGPAKGRKVWAWINYQHPKAEAQRIGQEELARLCKAVGIANLTDTEQLHNIPLIISVGVDKNDSSRNVIKRYEKKSAGVVATSTVDDGTPPWRR